ncbi:hypothetical protein NMG60_11009228 [Bertholletia excelsa]
MELPPTSGLFLFFRILCLDIREHNFFTDLHFSFRNLLCYVSTKWLPWNKTETQKSELVNHSFSCFEENKDIFRSGGLNVVMENLGIICDPDREKLGEKEILALFEEEEPSLGEVRAAFDVFDMNRDGFIDAGELQRVLRSLGLVEEGSQVENCKRMISAFDENGDGLIDFSEFLKFMENCFC